MSADAVLTTTLLALAAGWLVRRAWKGLRRRDRRGCGGGCGCGSSVTDARGRR